VLRAAHTAPTHFIAELKRSAKINMNYWLLKANPNQNGPFNTWILPNTICTWRAHRMPKEFADGDKVVIWKSGSKPKVVAYGYVENSQLKSRSKSRDLNFNVFHQTGVISGLPGIDELRSVSIFEGAVFLKAGPVDTIFRLNKAQGVYLFNAQKELMSKAGGGSGVIDLADGIGSECPDRSLSVASRFKRDPRVREYVLRRANGRCEYCGRICFTDSKGRSYLESHHIIALFLDGADLPSNVIALCPEHHREAHYGMHAEKLERDMVGLLNKIEKIKPNQALQRTNMLVTDRAPSSTLRAKHVRR
jgi:hypothetical protein